jgi:pheromone shutdown protein TraB
MQAEIYNIDYNESVHILGTTHFSKRSLYDGYRAVAQLNPTDLAIELDWKRYQALKNQCATCPHNAKCTRKCEFIGAVEALENRDVNVWLIDMSRREFVERLHRGPWMSSHWRVLLDERNTLMAARLAWIVSESLEKGETPCVLAMVGAAHVRGMRSLLRNPAAVKENLHRFGLSFTPPALIRHIGISGD